MASPGPRRPRRAACLPGPARRSSSASSWAAARGPRPRPPPRAPPPRAASAPAHGPLPSRASTGARAPGPPGFDRAPPPPPPPPPREAPAGARPEPRRPELGWRRREPRALAPVAPRALRAAGWELAARSRSERHAGLPSPRAPPCPPSGRADAVAAAARAPPPCGSAQSPPEWSAPPERGAKANARPRGFPASPGAPKRPAMTRPRDRSCRAPPLCSLPPRNGMVFLSAFNSARSGSAAPAPRHAVSPARARTHTHTLAHTRAPAPPRPPCSGSYYLIFARILSCPSRMRSHAPGGPGPGGGRPRLTRPLLARGDACGSVATHGRSPLTSAPETRCKGLQRFGG
ncbi:basic proline-rich protein-like [Panthera tigris]|uniref:basic proline-rich protein-like n=1 Tax=Panthera tigris TaxID=9694 RepID=UPI001C6F65AB|nr:basic proline-rich protein-like [Panthera tigris]